MLDILATVVGWRSSGLRVGLAVLTHVEGSAPRAVGSAVAVNEHGDVVGSISGGCVEADIYESLLACLRGEPAMSRSYGIDDERAHEHGLTCGGTLRVFCRALTTGDDGVLAGVLDAVRSERHVVLATRLDAPQSGASLAASENVLTGSLGSIRFDDDLRRQAMGMNATVDAYERVYAAGETVFVQSFAPKPDMLIFGAVDFSRAMASVGKLIGYRVTVVDARPVFATALRIPDADRIVVQWPDDFLSRATIRPSTALVVLTHDLKFDVPLLRIALESDAGYIGVMGSRQTNATRLRALRDAGVGEALLDRLHAPVGLDIGAQTPEETAISIAAEIVAARNGRRGGYLREGTSALHGPTVAFARESLRSA